MCVCFLGKLTTVKYFESLTNHCLPPHLCRSFLIVSTVAFTLQLPGSKGAICYVGWPAGQCAKVAAVHWIYFHLNPLIIFQRVAHFLKSWIDSGGALPLWLCILKTIWKTFSRGLTFLSSPFFPFFFDFTNYTFFSSPVQRVVGWKPLLRLNGTAGRCAVPQTCTAFVTALSQAMYKW